MFAQTSRTISLCIIATSNISWTLLWFRDDTRLHRAWVSTPIALAMVGLKFRPTTKKEKHEKRVEEKMKGYKIRAFGWTYECYCITVHVYVFVIQQYCPPWQSLASVPVVDIKVVGFLTICYTIDHFSLILSHIGWEDYTEYSRVMVNIWLESQDAQISIGSSFWWD